MPVKSGIVVVVIVAAALLLPTVQPAAREWLPPDYGKGSRVCTWFKGQSQALSLLHLTTNTALPITVHFTLSLPLSFLAKSLEVASAWRNNA